jgi:hypothetical protein
MTVLNAVDTQLANADVATMPYWYRIEFKWHRAMILFHFDNEEKQQKHIEAALQMIKFAGSVRNEESRKQLGGV